MTDSLKSIKRNQSNSDIKAGETILNIENPMTLIKHQQRDSGTFGKAQRRDIFYDLGSDPDIRDVQFYSSIDLKTCFPKNLKKQKNGFGSEIRPVLKLKNKLSGGFDNDARTSTSLTPKNVFVPRVASLTKLGNFGGGAGDYTTNDFNSFNSKEFGKTKHFHRLDEDQKRIFNYNEHMKGQDSPGSKYNRLETLGNPDQK